MNKAFVFIIPFIWLFVACDNNPTPKPYGYYRIELPEKEYSRVDTLPFPFVLQLPQYAYANLKRTIQDPNFLNVDFMGYGARIHMSYVPLNDTNLKDLLEDSRELVFKHTIKAQDIQEKMYVNDEDKVYGMYYELSGNTASSSQFYITDSTNHFLRGALYFNVEPNPDSLAPVTDFLQKDILYLIENFKWKQEQKDSL